MKKVTKATKSLLFLVMIFVLITTTACFSANESVNKTKSSEPAANEPKADDKAAQTPVEIRYAFWGLPEEIAVQEKLKAKFEELNPHIRVKLEHIAADYFPTLLTQIAGGNPADVFYIGEATVQGLVSKGALLDLMPYAQLESFDFSKYYESIFLPVGSDEGKLWAFPKDATPYMIYYNKDLYDKANVAYPTPDWTWADFEEKARALTIKDAGGKISQYGFAQDLWWGPTITAIYKNGGSIMTDDAKRFTFDDPAVVEALNWFKDLMYKDGGVSPTPDGLQGMGVGNTDIYNSQKAAMLSGGRWIAFFTQSLKANWGAVPFPKASKDSVNAKSPLFFVTLAAPKTTKHPQEAWEFIKFVTSEEGQRINSSTGLGLPVLKSVAEEGKWLLPNESKEHIRIYLDEMNNTRNFPFHPQWSKTMDEIFPKEMDEGYRNKQSMEQAAKNVVEKGNAELAK